MIKYFWKIYYFFIKAKTKSEILAKYARENGFPLLDITLKEED